RPGPRGADRGRGEAGARGVSGVRRIRRAHQAGDPLPVVGALTRGRPPRALIGSPAVARILQVEDAEGSLPSDAALPLDDELAEYLAALTDFPALARLAVAPTGADTRI